MARLNIEDSLFKDPRFMNLCIRLGCQYKALGALVMAWSLAQKWYLTPEKTIPVSEWEKHNFPDAILECGLAEIVSEKVRLRGSDEQFKWLSQRAAAGKSSSLKRLGNSDNDRSTTVQRPSTVRQPLTLSSFSKEELIHARSKVFDSAPGLESLQEIFTSRRVLSKLQSRWLEAHSDPSWICNQIRLALAWEAANPKKAKKDFGRFVTNWLARAAPQQRPKQKHSEGKTLEEAMKELYPDQWQEPTDGT